MEEQEIFKKVFFADLKKEIIEKIILDFEYVNKELGLSTINNIFEIEQNTPNTKYIKTSIRSGVKEEYIGSVVLIGDLNNGGQLIASGNIIILRGIKRVGTCRCYRKSKSICCCKRS